eukprot:jgi/Bigna1/140467/aug1.56_g15175
MEVDERLALAGMIAYAFIFAWAAYGSHAVNFGIPTLVMCMVMCGCLLTEALLALNGGILSRTALPIPDLVLEKGRFIVGSSSALCMLHLYRPRGYKYLQLTTRAATYCFVVVEFFNLTYYFFGPDKNYNPNDVAHAIGFGLLGVPSMFTIAISADFFKIQVVSAIALSMCILTMGLSLASMAKNVEIDEVKGKIMIFSGCVMYPTAITCAWFRSKPQSNDCSLEDGNAMSMRTSSPARNSRPSPRVRSSSPARNNRPRPPLNSHNHKSPRTSRRSRHARREESVGEGLGTIKE